jgi:hypothetical protein
MTTGYVDENWAKQHHDLWYAEVKERGDILDASSVGGGSAGGSGPIDSKPKPIT